MVFLAKECLASNRAVSSIRDIARDFAPRGVVFRGYFSPQNTTPAALRAWVKDYDPGFPVERDLLSEGRRRARATRTPQAVVFFRGKLIYKGRFDDRFEGWGRTKPQATRSELRDVLDAALAGRVAQVDWKDSPGCRIEDW